MQAYRFSRVVIAYGKDEEDAFNNLSEVLDELGADLQDTSDWNSDGIVSEYPEIDLGAEA